LIFKKLYSLNKLEFSTFSAFYGVENVENYEYFPKKMNISRKIKGFRIHLFTFSPIWVWKTFVKRKFVKFSFSTL